MCAQKIIMYIWGGDKRKLIFHGGGIIDNVSITEKNQEAEIDVCSFEICR